LGYAVVAGAIPLRSLSPAQLLRPLVQQRPHQDVYKQLTPDIALLNPKGVFLPSETPIKQLQFG